MATRPINKSSGKPPLYKEELILSPAGVTAIMQNWQSVARKRTIRLRLVLTIGLLCVGIILWVFVISEHAYGVAIFPIFFTAIVGSMIYAKFKDPAGPAQIKYLMQLLPTLLRELAPNARIAFRTNIVGIDPPAQANTTGSAMLFMTFRAPLGNGSEVGIALYFTKRQKGRRKFKGYKQKTLLKIWLTNVSEQATTNASLQSLILAKIDKPQLLQGVQIATKNRLIALKAKKTSITQTKTFVPDDGYSAKEILSFLKAMAEVAW